MLRTMKQHPAYVTRDELEEILDKRFADFEERFEKRLDQKLNEQFAIFFGKLDRYLTKRLDNFETRVIGRFDTRIDRLEQMMDASIKRHERLEDEQTALCAQVDRHEVWLQRVTDTASRSI